MCGRDDADLHPLRRLCSSKQHHGGGDGDVHCGHGESCSGSRDVDCCRDCEMGSVLCACVDCGDGVRPWESGRYCGGRQEEGGCQLGGYQAVGACMKHKIKLNEYPYN